MANELDKKIGTKEQPKLSAGSVIVKSVEVVEKESEKKGKKKFKMVGISILHPDKEELIKITNLMIVKVQGDNKTIMKDGIWYREDEDGNIEKRCNAAELLRFYKKDSLKDLISCSVTTEQDASGYLCIKAY